MLVCKRNSYYLIHIPDHNSFTRNSRNDGIRPLVLFHFPRKPSARFDYCPNIFFYCRCSHQHGCWNPFSGMGCFFCMGKFSKILQEHYFVQKVVTHDFKILDKPHKFAWKNQHVWRVYSYGFWNYQDAINDTDVLYSNFSCFHTNIQYFDAI